MRWVAGAMAGFHIALARACLGASRWSNDIGCLWDRRALVRRALDRREPVTPAMVAAPLTMFGVFAFLFALVLGAV